MNPYMKAPPVGEMFKKRDSVFFLKFMHASMMSVLFWVYTTWKEAQAKRVRKRPVPIRKAGTYILAPWWKVKTPAFQFPNEREAASILMYVPCIVNGKGWGEAAMLPYARNLREIIIRRIARLFKMVDFALIIFDFRKKNWKISLFSQLNPHPVFMKRCK